MRPPLIAVLVTTANPSDSGYHYGLPGGASASGASLQRVTLPLAVFTVKQRRPGLSDSAAAAGSGAGACTAGAEAGGGVHEPSVRAGRRYAGFMWSLSFTSPAALSPTSLHFLPE